jgi:transcription initiation factor TFIIIB Brf1 subunit/transcription initiation factor TFIIB
MAHLLSNVHVCQWCQSDDLCMDAKEAEVSCRQCGCVVESHLMDGRPEYRVFASDNDHAHQDPSRVGAPVQDGHDELGCSLIGGTPFDRQAARLKKAMRSISHASPEEKMRRALTSMEGLCSSGLHLPCAVVANAKELFLDYFNILQDGKPGSICGGPGHQTTATYAACVFLAVRCSAQTNRLNVTPKTIADTFKVRDRILDKAIKRVESCLIARPKYAEAFRLKASIWKDPVQWIHGMTQALVEAKAIPSSQLGELRRECERMWSVLLKSKEHDFTDVVKQQAFTAIMITDTCLRVSKLDKDNKIQKNIRHNIYKIWVDKGMKPCEKKYKDNKAILESVLGVFR